MDCETHRKNNMRITSGVIIAFVTLFLGLIFKQPYLWLPLSIFIASVIDLFTRRWVASNEIGTWMYFSVILKFLFAMLSFYATVGQVICMGLIFWWFVF